MRVARGFSGRVVKNVENNGKIFEVIKSRGIYYETNDEKDWMFPVDNPLPFLRFWMQSSGK